MSTPEQIMNNLLKNHPELNLKLHGSGAEVMGPSGGHSVSWTYARNPGCQLASLCDKYGSDKGSLVSAGHPYPWPAHTYTDFYARLWSHCRQHVRRVFECGLGTNNPKMKSNMGVRGRPGASLRVWRDYFPEAQVVGADIDKGILFQEDRIRTYYVDQLDPVSIGEMWRAAGPGEFDFMIDDGLHEFRAGISLFEHSIGHLSAQGVYVIEDVTQPDLKRYFDYFSNKKYIVDYISLHRPTTRLGDNSIVSIRRA
jgi:hypothetical protein